MQSQGQLHVGIFKTLGHELHNGTRAISQWVSTRVKLGAKLKANDRTINSSGTLRSTQDVQLAPADDAGLHVVKAECSDSSAVPGSTVGGSRGQVLLVLRHSVNYFGGCCQTLL